MVFVSDSSGTEELWISTWPECSSQRRLTFFKGGSVARPSWSPDSKQIVFDSPGRGVYVMGAEGGSANLLVGDSSPEANPNWSRDGDWIYFRSDRGGMQQTWKISVLGGDPIEVPLFAGSTPHETFHQGTYYLVAGECLVLVGRERSTIRQGVSRILRVTNSGVFFLRLTNGVQEVHLLNLKDKRSQLVHVLPRQRHRVSDISPDGRWLLCSRFDQLESDLMLIENFQ
jgi:hypothetical protein